MARHAACPTCTCKPATPAAGLEAPDHAEECKDAHRTWWRVWETQGTGDLAAIGAAAWTAEKARKRCPACKSGAAAPGKGTP